MGWGDMAAAVHRATMRTFSKAGGAIYRRPGLPDWPIANFVFDDTFFSVDPGTGLEVSSRRPLLGVQTSDLPPGRDTRVDLVEVAGVVYTITDVQPDGEAGTTLFLSTSARRGRI